MKHARPDYQRIQDPDGLIPDDEPVFLLRGQDLCAPAAVRKWADEAEAAGASKEIVIAARDQANLMDSWAAQIRGKTPDMPTS